ncbi:MAG TPA: YraN family protein, partial [Solirubrobacteraceae bacterium]|nr:YraN family protein [Solirubrobacteraceae bacterium]
MHAGIGAATTTRRRRAHSIPSPAHAHRMSAADARPPRRPSDPREPRANGRSVPQRPADPRRALGRRGERLAAAHLQRLGFAILARNVRTRHGEIDLIACDGETLTFVEVKTRRSHRRRISAEPPLAWLRPHQRARLRRLAAAWLGEACRERRP